MLKIVQPFLITLPLLANGPSLKTGQTIEYMTGDDGTYQAGITRSYSRSPSGVVTDNATGLQWQDDAIGSSMIWDDANTYCQNLPLDGGGWQLPTKVQLHALVDRSRSNPAIDPTFQNTTSSGYWSSSIYAPDVSNFWYVNFSDGSDNHAGMAGHGYVRCVRQ